jgi:hypothetical protein
MSEAPVVEPVVEPAPKKTRGKAKPAAKPVEAEAPKRYVPAPSTGEGHVVVV